ncbi:MAG: nitroreductase, partial [Pseudoflavonifractor sp.]
YPTPQQKNRPKPARFDSKFIVQENAYHRLDAGELREMFRGRVGVRGFEDWLGAFCTRKYESDFAREMSRSVEAYLRDFEEEKP